MPDTMPWCQVDVVKLSDFEREMSLCLPALTSHFSPLISLCAVWLPSTTQLLLLLLSVSTVASPSE